MRTWNTLRDILVKEKFRNQVKDCRRYPRAAIDIDYNLLMMKCHLKLQNLKKRNNILNIEMYKKNSKRWLKFQTKEVAGNVCTIYVLRSVYIPYDYKPKITPSDASAARH